MTSLVFAFRVDVLLVILEKIVKLNVTKENGVRIVKMIVAIVLMEHRVIELLALVMSVSLDTFFLFAVKAVNSINGVSTVMLHVTVEVKLHVIGRLANVLMVCVKLVSMVTLAVMNVNSGDMV